MALSAPFPPWLAVTPETYTSAMASGAKLGLAARAQDIRQQQAADRLQLAYEQLEAKEQMAAQALQGKMELANAQLELRDKSMQMTAALRERGLEQQWANYESMIAHRDAATGGGVQPKIYKSKSGQPYIYDPQSGTMKLVPGIPETTPPEKPGTVVLIQEAPRNKKGQPIGPAIRRTMSQKEYDETLKREQEDAAKLEAQTKATDEWQGYAGEALRALGKSAPGRMPVGEAVGRGLSTGVGALTGVARGIYDTFTGRPTPLTPTAPQQGTAPTAPTRLAPQLGQLKKVTTQAEYDELPPGTYYIGEDGKKYRKP